MLEPIQVMNDFQTFYQKLEQATIISAETSTKLQRRTKPICPSCREKPKKCTGCGTYVCVTPKCRVFKLDGVERCAAHPTKERYCSDCIAHLRPCPDEECEMKMCQNVALKRCGRCRRPICGAKKSHRCGCGQSFCFEDLVDSCSECGQHLCEDCWDECPKCGGQGEIYLDSRYPGRSDSE